MADRWRREDAELKMALRLAAYFKRQKRALLDAFEGQRAVFEAAGMRWLDIVFLMLPYDLDLSAEMASTYAQGQTAMARVAMKGRGMFGLKNPAAVAYAKRHAAELVTAIDATTRKETKAVITRALMDGKSYGDTASKLRELYDGYAGARALTIAVTETTMAYSAGTMDTARALQDGGLTIEKWWDAEPDCCDDCQKNVDDGWIPLDQPFTTGWDSPADSHPNCRCNVQTRMADPDGRAQDVLEPMGYEE